jgi:hypothetical protein
MTTQIRIAHRLAYVHSHEWAFMGEDVAAAAYAVGGVKLIADLTDVARGDSAFCGISAPFIADGVIHHTTGTGRLRWQIYEDGHTVLWVSRPSGDVLQASMWPNGSLSDATAIEGSGGFGPRHLGVLLDAINAASHQGATLVDPAEVAHLMDFGLITEDGWDGKVIARTNALAVAQARAKLAPLMSDAEVAYEASLYPAEAA